MKYLKSIGIILSMYTKIPMPRIGWSQENMKYSLCFLPIPGIITGLLEALWFLISLVMGFSGIFFGAVACVIPLLLTGGIHMDGFTDFTDAVSSHSDRLKKVEIMKDPHIGAFGVIAASAYLLIQTAAFYELYYCAGARENMWILSAEGAVSPTELSMLNLPLAVLLIFTASRALTAFAIDSIKPSKRDGMLYAFSSVSDKKAVRIASIAVLIICAAVMIFLFKWSALLFVVLVPLIFLGFKKMAIDEFGGISGDLCGWLIQTTEIILLIALIFVMKL